jgi:hypothetical protein
MLDELDNLNNKEPNWNEWLAKKFTEGIIGIKHRLEIGLYNKLLLAG